MTEAIVTAIRAKTAKAGEAKNAALNYALAAVALLGALATILAVMIW